MFVAELYKANGLIDRLWNKFLPSRHRAALALHKLGHAATGCAARPSARRPSRVIYQYTYCLRLFSKFVLILPRLFFTPPLGGGFLNGQPNNDWGDSISAFGGLAD